MNDPLTANPLLHFENFNTYISGGSSLLRNVKFSLFPRTILFLTGRNGLGKSTFLHFIAGHNNGIHTSGTMTTSPDLTEKPVLVPQKYSADFHVPLTLQDVIQSNLNVNSAKMQDLLPNILQYGLLSRDDLRKGWESASGGEQQRTILLRELIHNHQILLFDEPLNHLDIKSKDKFWQCLDIYIGNPKYSRAAIVVAHMDRLPKFAKANGVHLDLNQFDSQA